MFHEIVENQDLYRNKDDFSENFKIKIPSYDLEDYLISYL